jgi:hypothetical protein
MGFSYRPHRWAPSRLCDLARCHGNFLCPLFDALLSQMLPCGAMLLRNLLAQRWKPPIQCPRWYFETPRHNSERFGTALPIEVFLPR